MLPADILNYNPKVHVSVSFPYYVTGFLWKHLICKSIWNVAQKFHLTRFLKERKPIKLIELWCCHNWCENDSTSSIYQPKLFEIWAVLAAHRCICTRKCRFQGNIITTAWTNPCTHQKKNQSLEIIYRTRAINHRFWIVAWPPKITYRFQKVIFEE